ncbi:MAG TPA: sugar ABC transporter substrate-binding protein [Rhodopila sp.]|nr:sugar ABC transporter substrate-binding protein [Rhodopila sp.]
MPKRPDARTLQLLASRKFVDHHLERLDTTGVSRRDFTRLVAGGILAGAAADRLGVPTTAFAAGGGKIAYLYFSATLQYCRTVSKSVSDTAAALGTKSVSLDAEFNSNKEFDQFEQLQVAGDLGGIILNPPDASNVKRIAEECQKNKIWMGNVWATLPWYTPFDAGEYFTYYSCPDDFHAAKDIMTMLMTALRARGKKGKIIALDGIPGFVIDVVRQQGRRAAMQAFPEFTIADALPGNFNMEDGHKAAQDLMTRHPDAVGIYAANDEEAQGAIAVLKSLGLQPGEDVLIASAGDGNPEAAQAIKHGYLLCTAANVPQFMGAMMATRIYDVMNGWRPTAPERMMLWGSKIMTKTNVDQYIERYVNNNGVAPFNYRLMSKVLHPNDWDPQDLLTPLDMDAEWGRIPKPANYQYPQAYLDAKKNGEMEKIAAEYKAHYKIDMFGPSPNKPA